MSHAKHDTQAEINIKNAIENYGWTVCLFEADATTPAFAYTTGLWKNFNHPEIIAFGLPLDTMYTILNDAGAIIKAGNPLATSVDNFEILELHPVQFRQVHEDNMVDYFGYARWFYNYEFFPALQLFWTDKANKFPWETAFDKRYEFDQPLLDRKLDFKFFEPRNAATFIAEKALREGLPIRWAWHDSDDGTWSFANKSSDKMLVVGLSEAVELDPTINSLFDMPTGYIATRNFVGEKWKRKQI